MMYPAIPGGRTRRQRRLTGGDTERREACRGPAASFSREAAAGVEHLPAMITALTRGGMPATRKAGGAIDAGLVPA